MATESEIAWAAGLFEGEGCVQITVRNGYNLYARLTLNTTDFDVLARFHEIVGAGTVRDGRKVEAHHKAHRVWSCMKRDDVNRIMGLLYPWMGERRRNAIERAWQNTAMQPEPLPRKKIS